MGIPGIVSNPPNVAFVSGDNHTAILTVCGDRIKICFTITPTNIIIEVDKKGIIASSNNEGEKNINMKRKVPNLFCRNTAGGWIDLHFNKKYYITTNSIKIVYNGLNPLPDSANI